MSLLLISPNYGTRPDAVRLIEAARKKGIAAYTALNRWTPPPGALYEKKIAVYGEHAFCDFLAQELRLNLYQNSLDWVARLPHAFLKRNVQYMSLDDAINIENKNQSILNKKKLEPADDPCFVSGIYPETFPRVPGETPILVHSEYEDWRAKFRCVIVNGRIVSKCCYKLETVFNTQAIWGVQCQYDDTSPEAFVQTLLEHFNCAPGCIIDVGYIKHVGWAIVGSYPIWSAQMYGCDASGFLDGLFAACQVFKKA